MKKIGLFIAFLLLLNVAYSQASTPTWMWGKSYLSGGGNGGSISISPSGSIFQSGVFLGDSMTFGIKRIYPKPSLGSADNGFIAKYDASGVPIWASTADSRLAFNNDMAASVRSELFWAGIRYGDTTTSHFWQAAIYKFDSNGNVLWFDTPRATHGLGYYVICSDTGGNAIVGGCFLGPLGVLGSDTLFSTDTVDGTAFISQYSPDGQVRWALGLTYGSNICGISTDYAGNIYVLGRTTSDSLGIDDSVYVFHNPGRWTGFVLKLNTDGHVSWLQPIIGSRYPQYPIMQDLSVDSAGHIYITGTFSDSLDIDNMVIHNNPIGPANSFFARLDPVDGHAVWFTHVTAPPGNYNPPSAIAVDGNGRVSVCSKIYHWIEYQGDTLFAHPDYLYFHVVVMSLDASSGHLLCAEALSGGGGDYYDLAVDKQGNICIGGDLQVSSIVINGDTLNSNGGSIFIAKARPCRLENVNDVSALSPQNTLLLIAPNPSHDRVAITYSIPDASKEATLIVRDILGREAGRHSLDLSKTQLDINVSSWQSGVYLVAVQSNDRVYHTQRMVVE